LAGRFLAGGAWRGGAVLAGRLAGLSAAFFAGKAFLAGFGLAAALLLAGLGVALSTLPVFFVALRTGGFAAPARLANGLE
jgi:hypothetical protein